MAGPSKNRARTVSIWVHCKVCTHWGLIVALVSPTALNPCRTYGKWWGSLSLLGVSSALFIKLTPMYRHFFLCLFLGLCDPRAWTFVAGKVLSEEGLVTSLRSNVFLLLFSWGGRLASRCTLLLFCLVPTSTACGQPCLSLLCPRKSYWTELFYSSTTRTRGVCPGPFHFQVVLLGVLCGRVGSHNPHRPYEWERDSAEEQEGSV
jgi:hypothetical protein